MTLESNIASVSIYSGEFFKVTPILKIRDAGGNVIWNDSSSKVTVQMFNNPAQATLGLQSSLQAIAENGTVKFSTLVISTPGVGFTLLYSLFTYSYETNSYSSTSVSLYSDPFDVHLGPPRELVFTTVGSGAWAGAQPMDTQPSLRLTDYGGNSRSIDYSTLLQSSLVESLSVKKRLKINPTVDTVVNVTHVFMNLSDGAYPAGTSIHIYVRFNYDVWVNGDRVPYLLLNAESSTGAARTASLVGSRNRVRVLDFCYFVLAGDSANMLDYQNPAAFKRNGTSIRDGNGNVVGITLPETSLSSSHSISLNTAMPQIVGWNTSTADGEYGAGEHIYMYITYNAPVVVSGWPYLLLNVVNHTGHGRAEYRRILPGGKVLEFLYVVRTGDHNVSLSLSNYNIQLSGHLGYASIMRLSDNPQTHANTSILTSLVHMNIRIDTSPPKLNVTYGVRTFVSNGIYYAGEPIPIYVSFDKPVSIVGVSAFLYLSVGQMMEPATFARLLSDDMTLEFIYRVAYGNNATGFDIISNGTAFMYYSNDNSIMRKSTVPTTFADLRTNYLFTNSSTLKEYSKGIHVFGYSPYVVSISATTSTGGAFAGQTIYPDDFALITVKFSSPVYINCYPVLVVIAGWEREAIYESGNGTASLVFRYTVQVGDSSDDLHYRYVPNALCPVSGCPANTHCMIAAASSNPVLPAMLQLPWKGGSKRKGVHLADVVIYPVPQSRNTTVTSIKCITPEGEVGAGFFLEFTVTFSDTVQFRASQRNYPMLYLNLDKYANYVGGIGTNTLSFFYSVVAGDNATVVDIMKVNTSNSAIRCLASESCYLYNMVGQHVDLSTAAILSIHSQVRVYTAAPKIIDVWSDKVTSPYDGVYTVGEDINVYVEFDRPVIVTGFAPKIAMSLNNSYRYAHYISTSPNNTILTFLLTIQPGDYSNDLEHAGPDSLIQPDTLVHIFRYANNPITEVNYTLPLHRILARHSNVIKVVTSDIPFVTNVTTNATDARYAPGDNIIVAVHFSHFVTVVGRPYIHLNTGGQISTAYFMNDSLNANEASKVLYFKYNVAETDFSISLDYVDTHSLFHGLDVFQNIGKIRQVSSHPFVRANLDLPMPGQRGSLSHQRHIYIDGRQPYMTSVDIMNPNGVYYASDVIDIVMNFSAPVVVVGTPTILLETGTYDQIANYINGSGSQSLLFRYIVQPGDNTDQLDYHVVRETLLSAVTSYDTTQGAIYSESSKPTLLALVHLNPVGGYLTGHTIMTADAGLFSYEDLTLPYRGPDYLLRFSCQPTNASSIITTTQSLFVSFSNEFELRANEALNGDRVGWAVDISNDIAVLGAPFSNLSVNAVQTVTTSGTTLSPPIQEIQILAVTVAPQPAIQSFYTTADPYEVVGGYFTINYGILGPTRPIPSNALPEMIHAILQYDIPKLGNVTVTREPYIYCGCEGAFVWTLTFNDKTMGYFKTIALDGSRLTGGHSAIVGPQVIQSSAWIAGSFRLKAHGVATNPIPYDAGKDRMIEALLELSYPTVDMQISPSDAARGRSWTITFGAYDDSYEIPILETDASGLSGGNVTVWAEIARAGLHGPLSGNTGGLYGGFKLEWRGNVTDYIPFNATAADMKYALEALPVINTVEVSRVLSPDHLGYTWIVTFVSVNYRSERGYFLDQMSDLEPMISYNLLVGTGTAVTIGAVWNSSMGYNVWGPQRLGSYGANAGAVYVFQRFNAVWMEVAKLSGSDTKETDQFGTSVSLDGDVLVVGAIGASFEGTIEKQAIHCSADNGTFIIKFRGWSTSPLSYNITRDELLYAMEGPLGSMTKLQSMNAIDIDSWGGGGLCDNRTAIITLLTPVDGDAVLFGTDTRGDLELLTISNQLYQKNGERGIIEVLSIQNGTRRVDNKNSTGKATGAVYVFRAHYTCGYNQTLCIKSKWVQEAQFFPPDASGFERYGSSVAVSGNTIAVGAPGTNNEAGAVYVYIYSTTENKWSFLNEVNASVWSNSAGDLFGYCVAFSANTLVIGSPGRDSKSGSVYIFKPSIIGLYLAEQEVKPITSPNILNAGDYYGCSVAISGNLLVVGACYRDASTIYLGRSYQTNPKDTGQVFVFERPEFIEDFLLLQTLQPSNVRSFDRFGWGVGIDGNTLIVSAVENYQGNLTPSRAIMEISTKAAYSKIPIGGEFQLKWRYQNTSSGTWTMLRSRFIPYNAKPSLVKTALQDDLLTGEVLVSRSAVGLYDGSYVWTITFVAQTSYVPPLEVDTHELTGTDVTMIVNYTNPSPIDLRQKSHIFTRVAINTYFTEQMYASPFSHQPIDRCGWSVAVSGSYALVGCPNRDAYTSNANQGSGVIYDLGLVTLQFSTSKYDVIEGGQLKVFVTRHTSYSDDIAFYMMTLDRNAADSMQQFLGYLYGVVPSTISYPSLVTDTVGLVGTAIARNQSTRWIDGMYDYRGISDYYPLNVATAYLSEYDTYNFTVSTNADGILESPDENCTLVMYSPGLWPSVLGGLFASFDIIDNGDGYAPSNTLFQYEKLFSTSKAPDIEVGHSVAVESSVNMIATGSPQSAYNTLVNAGSVYVYRLIYYHWAMIANLRSPSPIQNGFFGDDVKINKAYGQNLTTIAVAEPGAMKVHVYTWYSGTKISYEASLESEEANAVEFRFATQGTLGLDGDVIVVGAPILEAVYVFTRFYNTTSGGRYWSFSARLRSSDFDYDILYSNVHFHRQEFGTAVALSGRTIAAGSPYADYDKLGTQYVEVNWDTEGTDIKGTGRGKAYMFYSTAPEQTVEIKASQQLNQGTYKLLFSNSGRIYSTSTLSFNTSTTDMKTQLETLGNIGEVSVSFSNTILGLQGVNYIWTITFLSLWTDPPLLEPIWKGHNCSNCTAFDYPATQGSEVVVSVNKKLGEWVQYANGVNADDRRQGDRFGSAVALDGDQLVVSAIYSSSITTTTWDFEIGTLEGWNIKGTAFSQQPTYGDNSYYRAVYRGDPTLSLLGAGEPCRLQGRYYVGTYELRPSNKSNYIIANSSYPAGSYQGDKPVGSMTSQVFMILGTQISFLIGGGCDASTEYVELLVDGFGVYKETGKCSERMERVSFDVSLYTYRAGQIRVVDAGVSTWGHINIDDIQFNWDVRGGQVNGTSALTNRNVYGGKLETVHSGAVYLFRRHKAASADNCVVDIETCEWTQQTKVTASDKRANDRFGTSISINDDAGVLLVGSPSTQYVGFYKEAPSVYPYRNSTTGIENVNGLIFPVNSSYMQLFQMQGSGTGQASAASGVWYLRNQAQVSMDTLAYNEAGAVYVFVRDPATLNAGSVTVEPHWYYTESVKIQAHDEFARDYFGSAVAVSDNLAVLGAPGHDGLTFDAGALYLYRAGFAAVSFLQVKYQLQR